MSQVNYTEMTNDQLKHYIVKHREDKAALKTYLERRNLQMLPIIANVKDTDFDDQLRSAIAQKLEKPFHPLDEQGYLEEERKTIALLQNHNVLNNRFAALE